jgi:hypothetical protein
MAGEARLALALVLAFGTAVGAQVPCEDDPDNENPNCSFESGNPPQSWTLTSGTSLVQIAGIARSGLAAALMEDDVGTPSFVVTMISACFPMTATPGYGFEAYFRPLGSSPNTCSAGLVQYSDASCSAFVSSSSGPSTIPVAGVWTPSIGVTSATGAFARMPINRMDNTPFAILIDDAFAGPDLTTPVELQSFEIE